MSEGEDEVTRPDTSPTHDSVTPTVAQQRASTDPAVRGLPREIGGHRILGVLGTGGMGVVYEAEQINPRRRVALKVVQGGRFVDRNYLRMFKREIATLGRLSHPGIASIYEAGCTEDGQHFFTMELVTGGTLRSYVKDALGGERPTRGQIRERLRLFATICAARPARAAESFDDLAGALVGAGKYLAASIPAEKGLEIRTALYGRPASRSPRASRRSPCSRARGAAPTLAPVAPR